MKTKILITLLSIFIAVGWYANLRQMNNMQVESYTACYVKGSGIIIIPIGTIMGYVGMFKTV